MTKNKETPEPVWKGTSGIEETIKKLKEIDKSYSQRAVAGDDCDYHFEDKRKALLEAIKVLEAQQEALEEMPEEKPYLSLNEKPKDVEWFDWESEVFKTEGFNQCHSIAIPIITKLKLKIAELEKELKEQSHSAQFRRVELLQQKIEELENMLAWMLPKDWDKKTTDFLVKSEEYNRVRSLAEDYYKLKEKLTVEKLDKTIKDYFGYKDISEPVYNMRYGCSLAQALIKELEIK